MTPQEAAFDLAAAFCLSAIIGFERQWRNRLAGLRTNTLVALGAASFVVFAQLYPEEASPTRVAAQVVSGIGFLGAGLIFREGCERARAQHRGDAVVLGRDRRSRRCRLSTLCRDRHRLRRVRQPAAAADRELHQSAAADRDRARGRLSPECDLPQSRRGAYPRAPAAGARRRRAGAAAPRQHRPRRGRAGRGDGLRHRGRNGSIPMSRRSSAGSASSRRYRRRAGRPICASSPTPMRAKRRRSACSRLERSRRRRPSIDVRSRGDPPRPQR